MFPQDIHVLVEDLDKIAGKAEVCCDMILGQRPEMFCHRGKIFQPLLNDSLCIRPRCRN